jgi:hypothetical protein
MQKVKNKRKMIIVGLSLFLIILIFLFNFSLKLIGNTSGLSQKIKYLVPQSIRDTLRETIYKSYYLEIENAKLYEKIDRIFFNNISFKTKKLTNIENLEIQSDNKNNYFLKKFNYPYYEHFSWGKKPPGYISTYKNYIILMSGSGELIYFDKSNVNKSKIDFSLLNSNFESFIDINKYYKKNLYGIRDISIINDELFVSFIDKDSCDKLSILRGKINLSYIKFKKFFSFPGCKTDFTGQDGEGLDSNQKETFIGQRSGGRIIKYNDENILFSIGDYSLTLHPPEAQNFESYFGSLVKINLNSSKVKILAKGLRNPQGLMYDNEKNFILLTDHGPDGGDELNSLNLNKTKFENFGWPISSYGEHYSSTIKRSKGNNTTELLLKGAPLKKSHSEYGFKEPVRYWTPSIGISEVVKIPRFLNNEFINDFFVSSMGGVVAEGDMTLHHIRLSKDYNEVLFEDRIVINERIRDIYFDEKLNKFVLLLGSSPSIAFLELK